MTLRSVRHVAFVLSLAAGVAAQPAGFRIETLVTGIDNGCAMAFAPDGRLFVAERTMGRIRAVQNGQLGPVWASVGFTVSASTEDGLIGIAVDPRFAENRYVYVLFTRTNAIRELVVGRFEEVGGVGTNLTIISPIIPGTGRHSGGPLVVGRDGKLYVAMGEAAVAPAAQSLAGPHGKVLRMNLPDGSVPPDNPFVGTGGFELAWCYGLRNAYGLSVHPRTGDIYETENGGGGDELNRLRRGGNFGWPIYNGPEPVPDPATEDPIFTYDPEPALTGAAFYSGALYPASFVEKWFVAAFNRGDLFQVDVDGTQGTVRGSSLFHSFGGATFAVSDGPDGNLYVMQNNFRARGADRVVRFVHEDAPLPSINVMPVANVAVGGSITFGVVGTNGDTTASWLAFRTLPQPLQTPFGLLYVPPDLTLPSVPIVADGRVYLGLPVPNDPNLRGRTVFVQGATAQGANVRLTNMDSLVLH